MDPPAADGGRRIIKYECQLRIGAGDYTDPPSCAGKSLGASATSLTLTDEDDILTGEDTVNNEDDDQRITNGTTYTFQVRAVNARARPGRRSSREGDGDWSNEATARPTDGSGTQRTFTISATIDGKSWARAGASAPILATVEVNPRYTAPSTELWVEVYRGAAMVTTDPRSRDSDVWADEQQAGRLDLTSSWQSDRRHHYRAVEQ